MSLSEKLLAEPAREEVIAALVEVVDQEVGDKKGISGTALKAGYAAGRKVMPNLAERAVTKMLPDFAAAADPFWSDFQAAGGGDFGQYLADRGPEAAQALLSVADARIAGTSHDSLKMAYKPLRGKAAEHVEAALPRLGTVLQKFGS